jgi:hypothetical protein
MKQTTLTKIRKIHGSKPLDLASRLGYVTNGILHLLIGIAAIAIVLGRTGEADASGVLSPFARTWYGVILLALIFFGLFSLSIWYIIGVGLARRTNKHSDWKFLAGHIARAFAYMVLALTTFAVLISAGRAKSSAAASVDLTYKILRLPLGRFMVFVIAIVAAIFGIVYIYRGLSKHFLNSVELPNTVNGNIISILGVMGYASKGMTLLLLGYVFLTASITSNPNKASGLDGAFRVVLGVPEGRIIMVLLGLGLVAYSAYSLARSRYSRQQLY